MREYNLLEEYPALSKPRFVSKNDRNIKHRIIASYREKDFFDGNRSYGYGGFHYDGRWKKIAEKIKTEYKLSNNSKILQINSEKGFFLKDMIETLPEAKIYGVEVSKYAYNNTIAKVKNSIQLIKDYKEIKFEDNFFDFILCIGVTYTLNLSDSIKLIKEIERVGKGKSFLNLASYNTKEDFWLMKEWSLLGTMILKKDEWLEILKHANYSGDYYFTNSETLNIKNT